VLICAGSAQAALHVSSFSVTPSTTNAGASPDVTVDAKLSTTDQDSPRDVTISLAPGLLANPSAAAVCNAQAFAGDQCPASSKIGDGTIVGTAPDYNTTVTLTVGIYLIAPQGSEVARVGAIAELYDYPVAEISSPIQLRTQPDVGINLALTGLPNSVEGTKVVVNELTMKLYGTVAGRPFTRNPTSCTPAQTQIAIASYGADSTGATSSFTPTHCERLAYAPRLAASATVDPHDDGAQLSTSLTQSSGEAATKSVSLTLPAGLGARLSALGTACGAADLSQCPALGSATITTPLLGAPLTGKIVLVGRSGTLPAIDVVLPPPFAFTLVGTPTTAAGGLAVAFGGIPDVPISSLQVTFAGGGSSLLTNQTVCSGTQRLSADLVAQSGARAHLSPTLAVHGCSNTGTASAHVRFSGLGGSSPKLTLTVNGSSALKVVGLRLPSGLSMKVAKKKRKGLKVNAGGWRLVHATKHGLRLSLGGNHTSVVVKLSAPALRVAQGLATKVEHGRHKKLVVVVTVQDATGKKWNLRVTGRAR
jgi:hypothetical protein